MVLLDGRLKHPVNSSSTICSAHFPPDCFTNWQQKRAGVAASLTLKPDALPSLFITSMDDCSKEWVQGHSPRTRSVDCQCDIEQRSVGTQLAKGSLLHVRSKAIQTSALTHVSIGYNMDFLLHTPKHISLKESGDPKRRPSYMQQYTVSTVRNGLMADVVVSVASLLQLFQKCLKCCSNACSVTTETKGHLFHVVQRCCSCGNTRNWVSRPTDQPADQPPSDHTPPDEQLPDQPPSDHTPPDQQLPNQPSTDQQLPDTDTLEVTEPVERTFNDPCMEEEITWEEMVQAEEEEEEEEEDDDEEEEEEEGGGKEEEEEEEEKHKKRKRKRRDSDEEWTPDLREVLEVSDEEPGGDYEEEEEHGLPVVWCSDCGEEASACCIKQKHLQLYCCNKCGYRDGDQELVSTDGQQTQHTISPESPTAADQGGSCDVGQVAEHSCSPEANSNNKQTASRDSLEDINSISSEGVLTSASQHATTGGIQEETSNGVNEIGSSCSIREQGSLDTSDQGTRNERPEDTSCRDQDSSASQVQSSNSCHQETSAPNEERRNPPKYAVYFNDPYSLQIHLDELHGGKRELCPDCGKFFIRREGQTTHVCDHKVKPLVCLTCGKRCLNERGLRRHSHVHTEGFRGLSCQYCYKKFRIQEDKQEHEETHKGESLKYRCSECPKRFADRFHRGAHRKTHWKHGRFFCKVCNKGFSQTFTLERHMAVHTGQKPYSCKLCDRSFNQSGHLKSHMRVHTGEKPFKCQDCGQCFNHNVSLKNHIQRKHGSGAEEGEGEDWR
ncbi:zinc finger and SCAN domain-containing protein 2-like isoform X2 [Sardina pilchardus]